jgi:hypothetical protein
VEFSVREIIYLAVSPHRVERMTKNLPQLNRGEIPVKLIIEVAATAFREPVIERLVKIDDWREGVDLADVDFQETFITEEEASQIRERRLRKMAELLESHGYAVVGPEPTFGDDQAGLDRESDAASPE